MVNPLQMHPGTTAFAQPPYPIDEPLTPGQHTRLVIENSHIVDDVDHDIEQAAIYSPSTDDLSVYSRQTPSPRAGGGAVMRGDTIEDTPTRKPFHQKSRSILRKSISTLFSRSGSMLKLDALSSKKSKTLPAQPENLLPLQRVRTSPELGRQLLAPRGRAMSTPNLLNTDGMKAVWDYQPATPSPLRNAADCGSTRPRAATVTTIRSRGSFGARRAGESTTVNSTPSKRYAQVFTPSSTPLHVP